MRESAAAAPGARSSGRVPLIDRPCLPADGVDFSLAGNGAEGRGEERPPTTDGENRRGRGRIGLSAVNGCALG